MQPQMNPYQEEYKVGSALQQERATEERVAQAPYLVQEQQTIQAALLEQLNPERIIENIKLTLRGKTKNMEGQVAEEGEPLMNDLGVGKIILSIRSVVNTNTIMSALDRNQINRLIVGLADDIIDDLTLNWREYGIKNEADRDRIEFICKSMTFAALMRSLSGGERSFLGKTTVESINTSPRMMQPKKQNFWGRFKL